MSNLQFTKKTVVLTTDELIHLLGLVVSNLNLSQYTPFLTLFGKYKKNESKHEINLKGDQLDIIKKICDSHSNQVGATFRFSAKFNMIRECLRADAEWETRTNKIKNTYKSAITSSFEKEKKTFLKK